jgi:hypothetical protein
MRIEETGYQMKVVCVCVCFLLSEPLLMKIHF